MDVPKLVFQLFDENNEIELVQPDKKHVHSGDFDNYEAPKTLEEDSKLPNISDINNEIERNICSISDIYDPNEGEFMEPALLSHDIVGRLPDFKNENEDYLCSLSNLQDTSNDYQDISEDNVFSSEPSQDFNFQNNKDEFEPKDILPSITDLQGLEYEVNKDMSRNPEIRRQSTMESDFRQPLESSVSLKDPFEPHSPEEEVEGLWFKGHSVIPPDTANEEELTKQCDKILTFDSQFALPIVCQPFIEKERQKRSFGEKDFQRHRKDQPSHTIFSAKKHHKSYKHKHSSRKDKTDGKDENNVQEEEKKGKDQLPKRPRSATFNATQVLALMPLQEISENNVDTESVVFDASKMKRSRSLSLHDSALTSDDKLISEDKDKEDDGKDKHKRRHRHHHKRHHHARHLKNKGLNAQDSLESRIRSGMHALESERKALREITDEIENFGEKDREDITSHRFGHQHGFESGNLRPRRHHQSGMLTQISDFDTVSVCSFRPPKPHMQIAMEEDKVAPISQLEMVGSSKQESGFVELEELMTTETNALQWKERARWIKFEEDVEKNERWGKPHVASLSFQSLLELRKGLETGDVEDSDEELDIM